MKTGSEDKAMWTWASEDGKHAAAGMSLGSSGGMKTGAGGHPQPYGWHGYYGETDGGAEGGSSPGPVFRGKVTLPDEVRRPVSVPEVPKYPPPPPAPRQSHLTYSQKSGELRDAGGRLMDKGHSGYGDYRDKPEFEDEKNRGPIPRGNYKVTEVVEDTKATRREGMGQHILRLEPADAETRQRLKEMNRDGFWIHNGESPRASQGCILTKETIRRQIPVGSVLRVTL